MWKRRLIVDGKPVRCEHGREVFLVDGTHVRNQHYSDFVQGGNGYRYRFCPKNELWVEAALPEDEVLFILLHECVEAEEMKKGLSYEDAHDIAKRIEDKERRAAFGPRRKTA
jgi:hypothetical protein